MDNQNSFGDRQMFQGDWTCAGCGAAITELPFQPDGERPLYCRDCHRQKRNDNRGSFGDRPQRQMHQGNWSCSQCGTSITELPFEPRDEQSLLCRDCYRQQKNG